MEKYHPPVICSLYILLEYIVWTNVGIFFLMLYISSQIRRSL